jgi:hypothetical protein
MANTQLVCPHCGSALNFGMEILAGTPIECLICMQSFTAQPAAAAPIAKAKPAVAASAKPAPVATAVTAATAVEEAPKRMPPPIPVAAKAKPDKPPTPRVQQTPSSAKLLLAGVAVMLLVLLTAGGGLGVWFMTRPVGPADTTQIAANDGSEQPPNLDKAPGEKPSVPLPGEKKLDLTKLTEEELEELRRRKEAEKIHLARKIGAKPGGGELQFDPITTLGDAGKSVAGLDQKRINATIDKGIAFLRKSQNANGSWTDSHTLGHAAIGGLTLLECGLPPNDLNVTRAAGYVRAQAAANKKTYELSLSVLFLDRLGDPRDRPLIQGLALRILAGQNDTGGWSYDCPQLPPREMYQLYTFLQSHRPANMHNPVVADGDDPFKKGTTSEPTNTADPFRAFSEMVSRKGIEESTLPAKKGAAVPLPKPKGGKKLPQPISPLLLMPNLQSLPVVQNQGKKKGQTTLRNSGGDNSNTQFALLAVWAARRHGIPTDAALVFAYQRFQVSQSPDGGWGYTHHVGISTHTMTCVGLLGQAMGHGAAPDIVGFNPKNPKEPIIKPVLEDPAIQRGLVKLSNHIGEPSKDKNKTNYAMENLYFLWSVERVAMLYDLDTINGKDWYGWGAQILVHTQQPAGEWLNHHYHGGTPPLNTCFALLFLRRSNLVQDLTNQIRLNSAIRDPEK